MQDSEALRLCAGGDEQVGESDGAVLGCPSELCLHLECALHGRFGERDPRHSLEGAGELPVGLRVAGAVEQFEVDDAAGCDAPC